MSLTIDYTNGVLTLIFEDTGTGMTEDEQQRVFGAFERLSNAAAKDGFGLGLAIVHNIVAMLDGKIHLESEKEMQAVRDAAMRNDLQELDALTHHLRSSWEILRADQPLKVLYGVLHGKDKSDNEALSNSVTTVLDKGAEIIQLAKEERRKYENG